MLTRITTSANLKNYRFNLQRSTYNLNQSQTTVLTGRNFNSYKENTSAASRSFQMRSNLSQTASQVSVSQSVISKYEVAWSTLGTTVDDVNSAKSSIIYAANTPTGPGRLALSQELDALAESIVHYMNTTYGSNHVFAGSDGLNAPFALTEDGVLTYRGIDVTTGLKPGVDPETATDAELEAGKELLDYLATGDTKYQDLGIGLDESTLATTSFNTSLSGLYYLGYGTDEDGDSKNIVCIMSELSQILSRCDPETGMFTDDDQTRFDQLFAKFESAASSLTNRYTELDATAAYLKNNHSLLENRTYTLKEQISNLEDADAADAITAYEWADYCYNAALQVGGKILGNTLMDYLNT